MKNCAGVKFAKSNKNADYKEMFIVIILTLHAQWLIMSKVLLSLLKTSKHVTGCSRSNGFGLVKRQKSGMCK